MGIRAATNSFVGMIVADSATAAMPLRSSLERSGVSADRLLIVPVDGAVRVVAETDPPPRVVFLLLGTNPFLAMEILRELKAVTTARLAVVGKANDPKLILRAIHSGAEDFLDGGDELDSQVAGFVARLQDCGARPQADGQMIAVTSASGGCGCSVLVINLAVALAKEKGRCVAIDLNLRGGDLAVLVNERPQHTLIDLCHNLRQLDAAMFEQSLVRHPSGIHLVAAPETHLDLDQVRPDAVDAIAKMARRSFPFVLIDLEDAFHREQLQILRECDSILLLIRLDFICLWNTRRFLDSLERIGIDRQRVRILANRHGQSNELSARNAEDALGARIDHYVPDDPKTILASINIGSPAMIESPSSKVCKSISLLARKLATKASR